MRKRRLSSLLLRENSQTLLAQSPSVHFQIRKHHQRAKHLHHHRVRHTCHQTSKTPPPPASGISLPPTLSASSAPAYAPAPGSVPSKPNKTGLSTDYYSNICPNLETLVQGAVKGMMIQSLISTAATLRLFFHDCFVTGCDASLMITNTNGDDERHNNANKFLRVDRYNMILATKAAVDADPQCTNKVSCSDIMALAARDSVFLSGGPTWKVELGRYDSLTSRASDVGLPLTTENVPELMKRFSAQGLSVTDLVALSGSHTLGATSCVFVDPRLYPSVDPTLDPEFASQLKSTCPTWGNPDSFIFFDETVTTFDNNYYLMLQQKKGVLFSDETLYTDASSQGTESKGIVDTFATDQNAFFTAFVDSMVNLGRLGVKTAADGEIRKNCLHPN
ncbi:hypothetical protein LUZ60_001603 [Juncus effusus]|nr:hypothetical protein LUZ60_001603 [Juncus effusus]